MKEREPTPGETAASSLASGTTTKCMARECSPGQMVECMKESTLTIRRKAMASSNGLMVAYTTELGEMGNSMVKECTCRVKVKLRLDCGKKESVFSG